MSTVTKEQLDAASEESRKAWDNYIKLQNTYETETLIPARESMVGKCFSFEVWHSESIGAKFTAYARIISVDRMLILQRNSKGEVCAYFDGCQMINKNCLQMPEKYTEITPAEYRKAVESIVDEIVDLSGICDE